MTPTLQVKGRYHIQVGSRETEDFDAESAAAGLTSGKYRLLRRSRFPGGGRGLQLVLVDSSAQVIFEGNVHPQNWSTIWPESTDGAGTMFVPVLVSEIPDVPGVIIRIKVH